MYNVISVKDTPVCESYGDLFNMKRTKGFCLISI